MKTIKQHDADFVTPTLTFRYVSPPSGKTLACPECGGADRNGNLMLVTVTRGT